METGAAGEGQIKRFGRRSVSRTTEVRQSLMDYSRDKHQIFKVRPRLSFFSTQDFMLQVNM